VAVLEFRAHCAHVPHRSICFILLGVREFVLLLGLYLVLGTGRAVFSLCVVWREGVFCGICINP